MAKDIETQIVEQAYNNAVLHPSPFLEWVSIVFILLLVTFSLLSIVSLYFITKDIYKNRKWRNAEVISN
jgi:uncharacterized Rmd1/YagE family protein